MTARRLLKDEAYDFYVRNSYSYSLDQGPFDFLDAAKAAAKAIRKLHDPLSVNFTVEWELNEKKIAALAKGLRR